MVSMPLKGGSTCTHEGQEAARLAHGSAVSQEADDEDEGSGSDEDVTQLRQHVRLREVLKLNKQQVVQQSCVRHHIKYVQ